MGGNYNVVTEKWIHVSRDSLNFIRSLLRVDPASRVSAAEALESPWIVKRHMATDTGS